MYSETYEDVDVICLFRRPTEIAGPEMSPLRMRRRGVIGGDGQAFKIRKITCHWSSMRGKFRQYHYTVLTETEDVYELVLDSGTMQWKLRCEM